MTLIVPTIFGSMIVAGRDINPRVAFSLGDEEGSIALGGTRRRDQGRAVGLGPPGSAPGLHRGYGNP